MPDRPADLTPFARYPLPMRVYCPTCQARPCQPCRARRQSPFAYGRVHPKRAELAEQGERVKRRA